VAPQSKTNAVLFPTVFFASAQCPRQYSNCPTKINLLHVTPLSRKNIYLYGSHKILVGKTEGPDHSEHLGVDGRIILEWILEKQ
jgi:hypothetical protein